MSYVVLTIIGPSGGDFMVLRTAAKSCLGDRLKRLGIAYVTSEDQTFDERFDVATDNSPAFARLYFGRAEVRAAVSSLFDMGFTVVRNDGKGIDAIRTPLNEADSSWKATIPDAVNGLLTLAGAGASVRSRRFLGISIDAWGWPGACLVPFAAVLGTIAAGYMLFLTNARYATDPYFAGSSVAAPLLALWIILSYHLIRGRAKSPVHLPIVWFASALTFWLAGSTWALAFNASLDAGQITRHVQPILIVERKTDELDTGYHVYVPSWHPGEEFQKIVISHAECRQYSFPIMLAKNLRIDTKPGFLGYEWICSIEPLRDDPVEN